MLNLQCFLFYQMRWFECWDWNAMHFVLTDLGHRCRSWFLWRNQIWVVRHRCSKVIFDILKGSYKDTNLADKWKKYSIIWKLRSLCCVYKHINEVLWSLSSNKFKLLEATIKCWESSWNTTVVGRFTYDDDQFANVFGRFANVSGQYPSIS